MRNAVEEEQRVIVFRDDSHTVDTKSRFANITPKIPFNAKSFIQAINDGIKGQVKDGRVNVSQVEELKQPETAIEAEFDSSFDSNSFEQELIYDRSADESFIISKYKDMGIEKQGKMLQMLKDSGVAKLGEASDEVVKSIAEMVRS